MLVVCICHQQDGSDYLKNADLIPAKQNYVDVSATNLLSLIAIEPPRNLRVTDISKNSVNLSWQQPAFDGGSKITGYIVERRDLPDGRWTKASFTNVIETQFTVSGLTQNSQYEFRVFARNAVGSISNPSEVVGPVTCIDSYGKHFQHFESQQQFNSVFFLPFSGLNL